MDEQKSGTPSGNMGTATAHKLKRVRGGSWNGITHLLCLGETFLKIY